MRAVKIRAVLATGIAILVLFTISGLGPQPSVRSPISADEFVRAIAQHRTSLIDLYFSEHLDPNARAAQDRPILLAATLQQDWETVRRLLKAGACVDLADETGLTPLMAAAMHGNVEMI
jgi:ankyrin repeat protein